MTPYWTSHDGRHVLYHGDCLEVLPLLAPGTVDAVVTSPPYNCKKEYGTCTDFMPMVEYWDWLERVFSQCGQRLALHGYLCVNHANYIGSRDERVLVADELLPILSRVVPSVDIIIWNKGPANGAAWGNFRTSPRMRAQHENIFIHGGVSQMPPSDINWDEWSRFTTSIWTVPTTGVDAEIHPAMMPVELAYRLCKLYSPADGLILEPFCGTGTTCIACVRTGRRSIGIELEERYCAIAVRRMEAELAQPMLIAPEAPTETQQELL